MSKKKLLNIFLADDDEDDRDLFSEALKKSNLNTILTTFEHGGLLINALQNNLILPDIIFLDINMPVLNGKECLKRLRSQSSFNNIPIIIYSTSSFEQDIQEMYKSGANLYVQKPIMFTLSIDMIEKVVELHSNNLLQKISRASFLFKY
jgi:CheY-like chemotaxis protein